MEPLEGSHRRGAILTSPCIIISLVILHIKYTRLRENDFNVYAYSKALLSESYHEFKRDYDSRVVLATGGKVMFMRPCVFN